MDSWARWTGIILVVAALLRAAILVAHDPLAGYANAGPMNGTSACVGLFPATDTAGPRSATPEAPIATYRAGAAAPGCAPSAESAFAGTVLAVARVARANVERFPLRWIGYAKLVLLFATAFAIAALLRERPAAAIAHGLVVLLVLADPVVTLWMSTLYREFFAIWALYAALASACVLATTEKSVLPWSLLLLSLAVLGLAREYDAVLGIALVAIAWPWLWHRSPRLAAGTALLAVVLWIPAYVLLQHEGSPHAPVLDIAYLSKALGTLQSATPSGIGTLEGARGLPLSGLPAWALSPLAAATSAMPATLFIALQAATFLMLPLAVFALLVLRRWRGDPLAPLMLSAALGAIAVHALLVALFGGAWDPVARFLPAILAMWTALVAGMVGVPLLIKRWIAEPRDVPLELGVGAATVGAAAYAVMLVIPA